jgi:hypothetical protein
MAWLAVVPLCASCAEEAPARTPRPAVPIKSACTAGSHAPSTVGFDVRPGRRHSEARTVFVTNLSDHPRTVHVKQVARVEGACSGDWARHTPLRFVDASTCEKPVATTVQPNQWIELQLGTQRTTASWDCTKLGLALWMEVDGEEVCADAGAWIAERTDDERE